MNLFVDTSSNYIILSIFNSDSVIVSKCIETNRNQSEIFIDEFSIFLEENDYSLNDMDNFFFTKGPGSFTGIRVGLSFAKGLLVSGYRNIYTLSSLEILMDQYQDCKVCIDARGNKFYYQEVLNNVFSNPKIVENIDLEKCNTYNNSLSKIPGNVVNLVNEKRYSDVIESLYIKEAF